MADIDKGLPNTRTQIKVPGEEVEIKEEIKEGAIPFKFRDGEGNFTDIAEPMFYVLSVKIKGEKVSIEMIDERTGKVWDSAVIKS